MCLGRPCFVLRLAHWQYISGVQYPYYGGDSGSMRINGLFAFRGNAVSSGSHFHIGYTYVEQCTLYLLGIPQLNQNVVFMHVICSTLFLPLTGQLATRQRRYINIPVANIISCMHVSIIYKGHKKRADLLPIIWWEFEQWFELWCICMQLEQHCFELQLEYWRRVAPFIPVENFPLGAFY